MCERSALSPILVKVIVLLHRMQIAFFESPLTCLAHITTSRRFKCVIRKWVTPLEILASGLRFIPLGVHFGSHRTRVAEVRLCSLGKR